MIPVFENKLHLIVAFTLIAFPGLPAAVAEVVRVEIGERKPFAEGKAFGSTGPYEVIKGRFYLEVDPGHVGNEWINDLDLAPRNGRGRVEFWSDFFLLQPADPLRGNRRLLYDVDNRGNKLALWTFNEAEGMLAALDGTYVEFARSAETRRETGDPRPAILERYPTREVYLSRITEQALKLHRDGYLLGDDAMRLVRQAAERDLWERND